jgi:pimeloyl-ACP methyl ester carboxylesterase
MRRSSVFGTVVAVLAAGVMLAHTASAAAAAAPTVVLVHGAWEQGSSWDAVAARLRADGYRVVVPEIALRTLAGDAASVAARLQRIDGPIVLAGHSYGGMVISNAAAGIASVKALVYVAGFAPEPGESTFKLDARIPGSLLPASIVTVPHTTGGVGLDVYVNPLLYGAAMANDVPAATATALADAQRPITLSALLDPSASAAWKSIASWYLVAADDHAIPPETERFMARRASATTVEIAASHVAHVSHPDAVADLILAAARSAGPAPPASELAVTALRLSPRAFRAARAGPAVRSATVRTGSRVSYTLNAPASIRFTVQRSSGGRTVGGSCVKPTARNRARRNCTRFVAVRGFERTRPAGTDRFTFTGRLGGRALRPAVYRLVVTPTADGHAGASARAQFRVVR